MGPPVANVSARGPSRESRALSGALADAMAAGTQTGLARLPAYRPWM